MAQEVKVSARFITVIAMVITLCIAVFICLNTLFDAAKANNAPLLAGIKDVVMFMLGAFVTNVTSIVKDYFGRNDRIGTNDPTGKPSN